MRKWIVAILMAGLFLSSITTSQASFDGTLLGDFSRNSELYLAVKNDKSIKLLNQVVVLPEQSFDQIEAAGMITRIGLLPKALLEKIQQNGIIVKLFAGKLTNNPTAQQLAGQVPRGYQTNLTWDDVPGIGGSKVVLAKIGSSDKGKGHDSVNLELHELAHSIDHYVYEDISDSKEFRLIWKKEHEQLFPGNKYFLFPEEYFAETFAMYFVNYESKRLLKEKSPKTFEFIEQLPYN